MSTLAWSIVDAVIGLGVWETLRLYFRVAIAEKKIEQLEKWAKTR